jgi:hypothetical protein
MNDVGQQQLKLLTQRGMEPAWLFFLRATNLLLGAAANEAATLGGWTQDEWEREVRQRLRVKSVRRGAAVARHTSNGSEWLYKNSGGWKMIYLYDRREMADLLLERLRRQLLAVPR